MSYPQNQFLLLWLGTIFLKWTQEGGLGWHVKLPFENLVHALCNFPKGGFQPNTLLPLAYNIKVSTIYFPWFWCCSLDFVLECVFLDCHIVLKITCHSYETLCMVIRAFFTYHNVIADIWQDQLCVIHMSAINNLLFPGV